MDRLLQGQYPRHKLVKRSSQPAETAISAFNLPKDAASTSEHTSPSDSRGIVQSSLLLRINSHIGVQLTIVISFSVILSLMFLNKT